MARQRPSSVRQKLLGLDEAGGLPYAEHSPTDGFMRDIGPKRHGHPMQPQIASGIANAWDQTSPCEGSLRGRREMPRARRTHRFPDLRQQVSPNVPGTRTRSRELVARAKPTDRRERCKNEKGFPGYYPRKPVKSAITYFPAEQYHRLQGLNFCVRDGNRCDPLHMVTDKTVDPASRTDDDVQIETCTTPV